MEKKRKFHGDIIEKENTKKSNKAEKNSKRENGEAEEEESDEQEHGDSYEEADGSVRYTLTGKQEWQYRDQSFNML